MTNIRPFLWFNDNVEEAVNFYTSVFDDAVVLSTNRYSDEVDGPTSGMVSATFRIGNQEFVGFNGGPHFKFSPAISFFVECETQGEIDYLWERLSQGGIEQQCGWLDDKFGLTWQITPRILGEYLSDPDPVKASRVTQAMLQMMKLDIAVLQAAYEG